MSQKKRQKTNKIKHQIQRKKDYIKKIKRYQNALYGKLGSKNPKVLKKLKNESYNVLQKVYYSVHDNQTALERFLGGEIFPKTYSDISNVISMPFGGSIESELKWTAFILTKYAKEINDFVELKKIYDSLILNGNYDQAYELLKQAMNNFGFSVWLIESNLTLAEYQGGLKSNRTVLENINKNCSKNRNLCVLANQLSFRAEKDISYANYSNKLHDFLNAYKKYNKSLINVLRYIEFKLDFIAFEELDSLAEIVHLESIFPIIDRYLTFIKVLGILATNNNQKQKNFVIQINSYLKEFINDVSLDTMSNYLCPSKNIYNNELQSLLLQGYDAYTAGDYNTALEITNSMLLKERHCFKIYELHVKSLLHLQKDFEASKISKESLAFQIMRCLYDVIAKNEKTIYSIDQLFKIGCTLGNSSISNLIFSFIVKHKYLNKQKDLVTLGELNALLTTPRFAMTINKLRDSLNYLKCQKTLYNTSLTIDFFTKIINNEDISKLHVPETRKLKYKIRCYMQENDYIAAIEELNKLKQLIPDSSPYLTDIVVSLFDCYLETKKYVECLHLVVDTFLKNRNLLLPLNLKRFCDAIVDLGPNKNLEDICWPILESIFQQVGILPKSKWGLYVALDDFLSVIKVIKPSQLKIEDTKKLIYLLRYICIPEVLEDTIGIYKSSEEIENERINICQILIKLDAENEDDYSGEIKRLMQEQMTRKAIQHIDKRRIHIETERILNTLSPLYQERFKRCLDFSRLEEVLRKSCGDYSLARFSEDDQPVVLFSDVAYEEFKQLFNEFKSKFISSNEYGLDSYLSARIRHGTLSGQIRSHFENENLITRKNIKDNNIYATNKYWIKQIFVGNNEDTLTIADEYLKEFSKEVDNTIEYVNNTLIQIASNDNLRGFFDYNYNPTELTRLWAKIFVRDLPIRYEEFLNIVIRELWLRTEDNLKKVRQYVRNDLRDSLTKILDKLSSNINTLQFNHNSLISFNRSVASCRTNIQNALETIAEWFRVTEEKAFPDFDLKQLVDITLSMVCKCYPSIQFSPKINLESKIILNGKKFESFVDIMFIIFENMAKHSDVQQEADIHISSDNSILKIKISNKISENINLAEAKQRVDKLKPPEKNAALMKFTRKEGGSGYYKLHKMLRHDLECEAYNVDFYIEEKTYTFNAIVEMNLKGVVV